MREDSPAPGHRLSLDEWSQAGRMMDYRGHAIFVRDAGAPGAEPLLLLHGFPTASWDWEALWPSLARQFRVYTLDMIGFGLSAKPADYSYSLMDQATLVESFLSMEDLGKYHLLAHDYGDSVAQELLARQQEPGPRPRLLSVAFLNGGLFPETQRPVLVQKLLLSPLGPLVARLTTRATVAKSMRKIFGPATQPDQALIDAFWRLITRNNGLAVAPKLIRYIIERGEHRERWVGAMQHARIPLKLINGMADPVSGQHMAARYEELIPQADVTLLENVGHYPQIEAPDAVLAAYLEFRHRTALNAIATDHKILTLRDGRTVIVRTLRSEDKDMLDAAFERLCKEARYSRFFSTVRAVPDDILHPTAPGPQGHAVALVALSGDGSDQVLTGGARYITDAVGGTCEFAVTIADDWRSLGLARQLMETLIGIARTRSVRRMEGCVLSTNTGMRRLATRLGFKDLPYPDDYSLRLVRLDLDESTHRPVGIS
ncbi:alpha/beta fold hydrolase [Dyella sp. Tek66A03]|uniref:alpha/beta fold hydrolase n=1 Tax=Dyella sp. Tek66A03 TaxID=3458298 RepID=UPI00403EA96D